MSGSREFERDPSGHPSPPEGQGKAWENGEHAEYRNRLNRLLSDDERDVRETVLALLQLGTDWLGFDHGILAEIDPVEGARTIRKVSPSHPTLSCGAKTPLSKTFCRFLLAEDDVLTVDDAVDRELGTEPDYTQRDFATYLGGKVVVDDELYGTVFFVADAAKTKSFTPTDIAVLKRLVHSIEGEMERNRRCEHPQRSRARVEALFEESPDMIYVHDERGNILDLNSRLCQETGIDRETLATMKVGDLDVTADPDEDRARWSRMSPGDQSRDEGRYRRGDGSTFPVEKHTRCLDLDGRDHFVVTTRDISEWKQQERDLQRTTDLLTRGEEMADVGGWLLDLSNGRPYTVKWTNKLYEIFELSPDEDPPLDDVFSYVHPEDRDRHKEAVERAANTGEGWNQEIRLITAEDNERWIHNIGKTVIRNGKVVEIRGSIQDITDRKRRERELRTAKEEAERAARLKTAMLANMSHEIRTPLTSINGFSEMLKDQLSGRHRTFAKRIYQSGQWLINTLDSVLELSRLEAGEYSPDRQWIRLDEVIAQSAERLCPRAKTKQISLTIRAERPVEAYVNEAAVTRIAENLIENAIKFTQENGEIEVRVQDDDATAVFAVEDDGIGIRTNAQSEIFEAFKQESDGLDREYGGSGLGLSITKNLVDLLGGTIEVESNKGRGSCFTVRLPKECSTPSASTSPLSGGDD